MEMGEFGPVQNINSIIVNALIEDDKTLILDLLANGTDINIQLDITTDDLVAAWDRRLKQKYEFGWDSRITSHSEEDYIEMNTINMIGYMNINVDHLVSSNTETQPLIMVAIRLENFELVSKLLELGCEVNAKDVSGYTPLLYAITKQNHEVVGQLLSNGADSNICSNAGVTPLLSALRIGDEEIVYKLACAGANLEVLYEGDHHGSVLEYAIAIGQSGCASALIMVGADAEFVNNEGENLIDTCLESWRKKNLNTISGTLLFEDLIAHGAEFEEMKDYPKIPGHFYSYGSVQLVEMMLRNGLEVISSGHPESAMPVLHEASINPSHELLQFLIDQLRIDLEIKDNHGRSVLFFACSEPHRVNLAKLKAIVDHGADLGSSDNYNRSIIEAYALSNSVRDGFNWLLKRVPLSMIKNLIPTLIEANKVWHLRQVAKFFAVLKVKKSMDDLGIVIEHAPDFDFFVQCTKELERMSQHFVFSRKLIDFVGVREFSLIARKAGKQLDLLKRMNFKNLYPIYWSEMLDDLREAVERQDLVLAAMKGIKKLTRFSYETCPQFVEQVTYYLSALDLERLSNV